MAPKHQPGSPQRSQKEQGVDDMRCNFDLARLQSRAFAQHPVTTQTEQDERENNEQTMQMNNALGAQNGAP